MANYTNIIYIYIYINVIIFIAWKYASLFINIWKKVSQIKVMRLNQYAENKHKTGNIRTSAEVNMFLKISNNLIFLWQG